MKKLLLGLMVLCTSSCKPLLVRALLKNPKVENTASVQQFQEKNNYSTTNSLILNADTSTAEEALFLGLSQGYVVFDQNGQKICYYGSSSCQGEQFSALINNDFEHFKVCETGSATLEEALSQTYGLNEKPVTLADFPTSDYYILAYWQRFLGGKRGYEDAVNWMDKAIQKREATAKPSFTLIKINTDFQENWGFKSGGKAKLKRHFTDGYLHLEISKFPPKK